MIGPDGSKFRKKTRDERREIEKFKCKKDPTCAGSSLLRESYISIFLSDVYDSLLSSNAKHIGPAMRSIHREVRFIRATVVNHTTLHIEQINISTDFSA